MVSLRSFLFCVLVALSAIFLSDAFSARESVLLRVGIAVPEGNSSLGLPAIAESLSSEALLGLGLDGRPVPRLAERWSINAGGRELRFLLPQHVRLHDGTRADAPMIAALVKEALQSYTVRRFHSRLADFYEVKAEGRSTILLRSRSPRILALEELTDVTLKMAALDAGLGPFVVDSLTGETIALHGFQQYFKGAPKVSRVRFQVYRSQRAAWTGMMRDEIDALYEVNREAVEFVERESRVRTHSFLRPYVSGIVFNTVHPLLRDPTLRRALSAAINRAAVVSSAYRGRARTASGPLAPTYWALAGSQAGRTHDPAFASSILSRYKVAPRGLNSARLRFRCLVPVFETQPLERTALIIQKQLYDFGVDVQLERISLRDLLPRLAAGDFDAVLMEFFGITPSWVSYFWHSPAPGMPALVKGGYSAADKELDAVDNARTEAELRDALRALYRKLGEDPPAIFIAWPEVTRAVSTRFEVPVEKGRDIMGGNLWLWRPAKER